MSRNNERIPGPPLRVLPGKQNRDDADDPDDRAPSGDANLETPCGCLYCIECFSKKMMADAPLLEIVGDCPLRKDLFEAATSAGLDHKVVFKGQLSFDETQQRLSCSRLLVLPSLCF